MSAGPVATFLVVVDAGVSTDAHTGSSLIAATKRALGDEFAQIMAWETGALFGTISTSDAETIWQRVRREVGEKARIFVARSGTMAPSENEFMTAIRYSNLLRREK